MRPSRCAVLALIAAAALAAAETSEAIARMQVEIDAAAGSAAAAAPDPRLNEHMMGLAAEMSDQLTDIMASLQHAQTLRATRRSRALASSPLRRPKRAANRRACSDRQWWWEAHCRSW